MDCVVMTSLTARLNLPALTLATLLALFATSSATLADDTVSLTIKERRFAPTDVAVPTGQRLRIEVSNEDNVPAEFESTDLHIEKIVVPGGKITVFTGPLKPGTYKFFDDYHPETSGTITATEPKASD
jgi:heme/copper-type cytochrome/quinol oxidase subunit 2